MHSIILPRTKDKTVETRTLVMALSPLVLIHLIEESISYDTNIYILWCIHSFWCSLLKYVGLQGPKNGESLLTFQYYSNLFHVALDLDSYSIYTVYIHI